MKTLYLDPANWDLALDSSGNIATATDPYRMAQDAACACRTFLGEVYYDTARGVPYFDEVLGHRPPLELIRARHIAAAKTAEGVADARVFYTALTPVLTGQVQVFDASGAVAAAGF